MHGIAVLDILLALLAIINMQFNSVVARFCQNSEQIIIFAAERNGI